MDRGYTTEIATGQVAEVPSGSTATSYEIDGTLLVSGTLTASEVGNSVDLDDAPPYNGSTTLPISGTLVVEDGGSASGITLQNAALVDVGSGGELSNFSAPTAFGGDGPNIYNGVQVNVLAGGFATGGTLDGGYLTVAGTANDLTTFGEQITIAGTVSGLTSASNFFYDHGGFGNVTTIQDGGSLQNSTLSGPGDLITQLGATASGITLTGNLDAGLSPDYPMPTGGETLIEQAASTVTDLTATGGSVAELAGYTGGLTIAQQAEVYVTGGLAGADVSGGDRNVYQFLGVGSPGSYDPYGGQYFSGLAIASGGDALGVIDDGLMAVESGGQATDVDVQATLGVFTGGTVTDATLEAGSQTLLGGKLVYDGSGTTVDKGAILSTTLSDSQDGQPGSVVESFTSGQVVQDGSGTLVLDAFNTFGGGIVIDMGTVELAAANAAGAGFGVRFVEPANGLPTLEVLKLDPAFAGATVGGTTEYFPTVSGLAFGTVIDITGQAFQQGDKVSVIDGETALALDGPKGALHDTISIASGAASGLQFLAFGDGAHGTDLVALPSGLLSAAGSSVLETASMQQVIADEVARLGAGGSTALAADFGLAASGPTIVGRFSDTVGAGVASRSLQELVAAPTTHVTALRS